MQFYFRIVAIIIAIFSVNGEVNLSETALVENATDAMNCYNSAGEMLVGQIRLLSGWWSVDVQVTSEGKSIIAQGSWPLDDKYFGECAGVIKSNLQRQWLTCFVPVHGDLKILSWENNVWSLVKTPVFTSTILLCDVFSDPSPGDGFVVMVQDRDSRLTLLRPNIEGNKLTKITEFTKAEYPEAAFMWGFTHQYYHQNDEALAIAFNFVYPAELVIEPREFMGKIPLPITTSSEPTSRNFSAVSAVVGSPMMVLFYGKGCNVTLNLPFPYANLGQRQQMLQTKSDTFFIPVFTKLPSNHLTGVLYLIRIINENINACGGQEDLEIVEAFHLPLYSPNLVITSSNLALDKSSFTWVITVFDVEMSSSIFIKFASVVDAAYLPSFLELDGGIIDESTQAPTGSPHASSDSTSKFFIWEMKETFVVSSALLGIITLGILNSVYNILLYGDTMQLYLVEHMF